jgi:hypothetical protein
MMKVRQLSKISRTLLEYVFSCLIALTLRSYESRCVTVRMLYDLTTPVAELENRNINTAISLNAAG